MSNGQQLAYLREPVSRRGGGMAEACPFAQDRAGCHSLTSKPV